MVPVLEQGGRRALNKTHPCLGVAHDPEESKRKVFPPLHSSQSRASLVCVRLGEDSVARVGSMAEGRERTKA
jgi:hypothetical protein